MSKDNLIRKAMQLAITCRDVLNNAQNGQLPDNKMFVAVNKLLLSTMQQATANLEQSIVDYKLDKGGYPRPRCTCEPGTHGSHSSAFSCPLDAWEQRNSE